MRGQMETASVGLRAGAVRRRAAKSAPIGICAICGKNVGEKRFRGKSVCSDCLSVIFEL